MRTRKFSDPRMHLVLYAGTAQHILKNTTIMEGPKVAQTWLYVATFFGEPQKYCSLLRAQTIFYVVINQVWAAGTQIFK